MVKGSVIYIYDALCGWCYGFSPVAVKLKQRFSKDFAFEVWSGGMVTGDRVGPLGPMADYIEKALPQVESQTGMQFGKAYLNNIIRDENYISNSFPPALALTVFKSFQPENAAEFAHQMQRALFQEGKDLNALDHILDLLPEWGISPAAFRERYEHPEYSRLTNEDFQKTAELGVTGFPMMLLLHGDQYYLLAQGYKPYQDIANVLERVASYDPGSCCAS